MPGGRQAFFDALARRLSKTIGSHQSINMLFRTEIVMIHNPMRTLDWDLKPQVGHEICLPKQG